MIIDGLYSWLIARTVMLDRWGVELMCSILEPHFDVLEYGSGGSTTFFQVFFLGRIAFEIVACFHIWFSQFVQSWTSMEHDNKWEPKVTILTSFIPEKWNIMWPEKGEKDPEYGALG